MSAPGRPLTRIRHRAGAVVVLSLVPLLAGCAARTSPGGGGTSAPTGGAVRGTVTVFAAASLTGTFRQIAAAVESAHPGLTVRFSFGASSDLAQQIVQGAPADVFAAADQTTMAQVTRAGAAAGQPAVFTRNELEIAVPKGNPAHVTGLADFANPKLRTALCARQVPCGAAAIRVFAAAGITPRPSTLEADVKATLTKVELGEVDAALVYRTDVRSAAGRVDGIDFPQAARAVNTYPIVVCRSAPNPAGAKAFLDAVLSPAGQAVLRGAGFQSP